MLNGQQFQEFVSNVRAGGDTVHAETGERPETGVMVSIPGRERRYGISSFDAPEATAYAGAHARELADPDQYLGGWRRQEAEQPTDADQAVLDVSRRYPTAEEGVTKGWAWNQEAVHRLDDHKDIDVPDSPRDLPIWKDYRRLPE